MTKPKPKNKPKPAARRERERPERREREERDTRRGRSRERAGRRLDFENYSVKGASFDGLDITNVKLALLDSDGPAVALASIEFNEALVISGIRVIESKKGLFVSMPQRESKDGEWHDIAFPVTKAGRETISEAVLDAYDQAGGK